MKKLGVLFCGLLISSGCASVFVVTVDARKATKPEDVQPRLDEFYRSAGFHRWTETEDREQRMWRGMMQQDPTLKDIWIDPGKKGGRWDRGIVLFDDVVDGVHDIRLVFQKGGNERAAEQRAKEIAVRLKDYVMANVPEVTVVVIEQRSPDLR